MKPAALVNTSATEIQRSIFRELSPPSLFESAETTFVGEGQHGCERMLMRSADSIRSKIISQEITNHKRLDPTHIQGQPPPVVMSGTIIRCPSVCTYPDHQNLKNSEGSYLKTVGHR